MGLLRDIFGRSKNEIWEIFSREIDANFIEGGFWRGDKVVAKVNEWTVTLDTYDSGGETSSIYTRIRAPYVNKDGFRFKFYRKTNFSDLGKLVGMQNIEIGIPSFDKKYIIQGNNQQKVKELFANQKIRGLIETQSTIYFKVKDDDGIQSEIDFPDCVDILYFEAAGVINDIDRLKKLFTLFVEILNQLCLIGSACRDNPKTDVN